VDGNRTYFAPPAGLCFVRRNANDHTTRSTPWPQDSAATVVAQYLNEAGLSCYSPPTPTSSPTRPEHPLHPLQGCGASASAAWTGYNSYDNTLRVAGSDASGIVGPSSHLQFTHLAEPLGNCNIAQDPFATLPSEPAATPFSLQNAYTHTGSVTADHTSHGYNPFDTAAFVARDGFHTSLNSLVTSQTGYTQLATPPLSVDGHAPTYECVSKNTITPDQSSISSQAKIYTRNQAEPITPPALNVNVPEVDGTPLDEPTRVNLYPEQQQAAESVRNESFPEAVQLR
jgi:hypothetical protein